MDWLTLTRTIIFIIMVVTTIIPTLVAYTKARKKRTNAEAALQEAVDAKDKAEAVAAKEKADAELRALAKEFVASMESTLGGLDKLMKMQGDTAGLMKKELVFNKLQACALQRGYEFDVDYWNAVIDDLVTFTKSVNVNDKKQNIRPIT